MKTKEKTLKLAVTFPPRMSKLIARHAKVHKLTLERAVEDLTFHSAISNAFWDSTTKILSNIFRKKTG